MKCKLFKADELQKINDFIENNNHIDVIKRITHDILAVYWYEPDPDERPTLCKSDGEGEEICINCKSGIGRWTEDRRIECFKDKQIKEPNDSCEFFEEVGWKTFTGEGSV